MNIILLGEDTSLTNIIPKPTNMVEKDMDLITAITTRLPIYCSTERYKPVKIKKGIAEMGSNINNHQSSTKYLYGLKLPIRKTNANQRETFRSITSKTSNMPCLPRLGRFLKLYKILLTDFIEVGLQLNYELFRLFNKFFKSLANSELNGEIIRDIINIFVDFGNTIEVKVNAANLKSMVKDLLSAYN